VETKQYDLQLDKEMNTKWDVYDEVVWVLRQRGFNALEQCADFYGMTAEYGQVRTAVERGNARYRYRHQTCNWIKK